MLREFVFLKKLEEESYEDENRSLENADNETMSLLLNRENGADIENAKLQSQSSIQDDDEEEAPDFMIGSCRSSVLFQAICSCLSIIFFVMGVVLTKKAADSIDPIHRLNIGLFAIGSMTMFLLSACCSFHHAKRAGYFRNMPCVKSGGDDQIASLSSIKYSALKCPPPVITVSSYDQISEPSSSAALTEMEKLVNTSLSEAGSTVKTASDVATAISEIASDAIRKMEASVQESDVSADTVEPLTSSNEEEAETAVSDDSRLRRRKSPNTEGNESS